MPFIQSKYRKYFYFCIFSLWLLACGKDVGQPPGQSSDLQSTQRDIFNTFETLSFDELISLTNDDFALLKNESNSLIDAILKDKNVSSKQKEQIQRLLFGRGDIKNTNTNIKEIFSNIIDKNLREKIEKMPLPASQPPIAGQRELTNDELTNLTHQLRFFFENLPRRAGLLDQNGDGKINLLDYLLPIHATFYPGMLQKDILNRYLYWRYFVDISKDEFQKKIWPNPQGFKPPKTYHIKPLSKTFQGKVYLLDFNHQLALKPISKTEAKAFLKNVSYEMPKDFLDELTAPLYQTVAVETPSQDILVQNVLFAIPSFSVSDGSLPKTKLYFNFSKKDIPQNAVILTQTTWIQAQPGDDFTNLSFLPQLISSVHASGIYDALRNPDPVREEIEYIRTLESYYLITHQESLESKLKELKDRTNREYLLEAVLMQEPRLSNMNEMASELYRILDEIQVEHDRLLAEAQHCEDQIGLTGKNECTFIKLYEALQKLEYRIDTFIEINFSFLAQYHQQVVWARNHVRHHEKREFETLTDYETFQRLNVIPKILDLILGLLKTTVGKISAFIAKEVISEVESRVLAEFISIAANTMEIALGYIDTSQEGTLKAFLEGMTKLIRYLKNAVEAARKGEWRLFKFGAEAAAKIGFELVTLPIEIDFHMRLADIDSAIWAAMAEERKVQAVVDQMEAIDQTLQDLRRKVRNFTILERISTFNKIDRVKFEKQHACHDDFQTQIQTLNDYYQRQKQAEQDRLHPFHRALSQAEFEYKEWQYQCDVSLDNIEFFGQEKQKWCGEKLQDRSVLPSVQAGNCEHFTQKLHEEARRYAQQLQCHSSHAPTIINYQTARENYENTKQSIQTTLEQLDLKHHEDIQKANLQKDQCLNAIHPNCTVALPEIPILKNSEEVYVYADNLRGAFGYTLNILKGLVIQCTGDDLNVQIFPKDGVFTACDAAAQKTAYLIMPTPQKYIGGNSLRWSSRDFPYGLYNWHVTVDVPREFSPTNKSYTLQTTVEGDQKRLVSLFTPYVNTTELVMRATSERTAGRCVVAAKAYGGFCPYWGSKTGQGYAVVIPKPMGKKIVTSYNTNDVCIYNDAPKYTIDLNEVYIAPVAYKVRIYKNTMSNPNDISTFQMHLLKTIDFRISQGTCHYQDIARMQLNRRIIYIEPSGIVPGTYKMVFEISSPRATVSVPDHNIELIEKLDDQGQVIETSSDFEADYYRIRHTSISSSSYDQVTDEDCKERYGCWRCRTPQILNGDTLTDTLRPFEFLGNF